MTQHPRRQTGYKLLGYRVTKNNHEFLDDNTFSSIQAAKEATEAVCDYPLEWRVRATDPDGLDYTEGGHPRAVARDDELAKHAFSHRRDWEDPDPGIRTELGRAASWDRYYIEPVKRPIYEKIRDAEVVSGDYYVQRNGSGWWDVHCNHHWVDSFPTRVEAIASIWDRLAMFERRMRSPRRTAAIETAIEIAKLVSGAVIIMAIFMLADMWRAGTLLREGWRVVWMAPVGVLALGLCLAPAAALISMREGVIRNIIAGVIAAGMLAFLVVVALDQYRAGDWHFIIYGGIVFLSVVAAIWEGGKRLPDARGKRAP
jgi:hypothetical protein